MSVANMSEKKANRRRHQRFPVNADIELVQPGRGTLFLKARDINQAGAFFEVSAEEAPAKGSVVFLRIDDATDAHRPEIIKARVVRQTDEGIGVAFET